MSGQPASFGGTGKKAVHVKWAGKTIALGTFPAGEADEKCARAKALTRAWRSTMRPKPSRDWVMLELERLGVRQVSGRLGRKGPGEDGEEGTEGEMPAQRNNSLGWPGGEDLNTIMQRRSSSLGFNMMDDDLKRRNSSMGLGMPPHHRPLVGGGSAAAYEAARADHYSQKAHGGEDGPRRTSGFAMGMGGMGGSGAVNANQHYEMLKLHHMNLLNEIQETTLMMNLYQQQQLQQQQSQLGGGDGHGAPGVGGEGMPGRPSLGLGTPPGQMIPGGDSQDPGSLEDRLQKLKDDIARRQKEAEELEAAASTQSPGTKRKAEDDEDAEGEPSKKLKEHETANGDDKAGVVEQGEV